MLTRLSDRYGWRYMNGERPVMRYVRARHVRFTPLWPTCIADFLVLDTWGNYGPAESRHPLLGFEVKTSRSDWLRELNDPEKSRPFREVCREWWIVVSDASIVRDDLPAGYGLLVARGSRLRVAVAPAPNPNPLPMPRGLVAGFARAVATQHEASA